jgi:hypothetical protein
MCDESGSGEICSNSVRGSFYGVSNFISRDAAAHDELMKWNARIELKGNDCCLLNIATCMIHNKLRLQL